MGCRLKGMTQEQLRQALGIAEYHGPRSQMMREIATPTMLHDGSGMGALTGIMAAELAGRGFTGAPAITVEAPEAEPYWRDLGQIWTIDLNYIKPYPVCRWAHAAIDAVRVLMQRKGFGVGDIRQVTVNTFHEAAQLFPGMPDTTSKAQYSLAFAVGVMLVHGRISPENIQGKGLRDSAVAGILEKINIGETGAYSARFPQDRVSDVVIELTNGTRLESGTVHATGGPESPMASEDIRGKFAMMSEPLLDRTRTDAIWNSGRLLVSRSSRFSDFADLVLTAPG